MQRIVFLSVLLHSVQHVYTMLLLTVLYSQKAQKKQNKTEQEKANVSTEQLLEMQHHFIRDVTQHVNTAIERMESQWNG